MNDRIKDSGKKGTGLLLIMMEVEPEYEEEFNRWYWEEHVPERMAVPGFISARRYQIVEGSPKYLALYEVESAEVLQSEAYKTALANATPWTTRMRQHYTFTRNIYEELLAPTPPA